MKTLLPILLLALFSISSINAQALYPVNERIMSNGIMDASQLIAFFAKNKPANVWRVERLAQLYIDEAQMEGVNHDIAFVQMIKETGWLNFSGSVPPEYNNFGGIGSTKPGEKGHRFEDEQTGVRAHIQHLKAYASKEPLNNPLVDPRYHLVPKGTAPTVSKLKWATDPNYNNDLIDLLRRMYRFTFY